MIKIYTVDTEELKDREIYEAALASLPELRRERAERLRREDEKRRSVGAGLLLCRALGEQGIEKFTLRYGEWGKPYLEGREDIFFSLSHSGERAMCVISDREVGCDVEKIGKSDPRLAERFFSEGEKRLLEGLEGDEAELMFYRIWTAKESFLKAVGMGLRLPMSAFSLRSDCDGSTFSVEQDIDRKSSFSVRTWQEGDYCFAVCYILGRS